MTHAHKIFIRTKKEDSAFVYNVLEAHEGIAAYTTLPFRSQDPFRDLELLVTEELKEDLLALLQDLKEMVEILPDDPSMR
jgi:hypothetical protein